MMECFHILATLCENTSIEHIPIAELAEADQLIATAMPRPEFPGFLLVGTHGVHDVRDVRNTGHGFHR